MFDATNTTRERREMILNFAIDNSYKVSYKILVIMGLTLYIYIFHLGHVADAFIQSYLQ